MAMSTHTTITLIVSGLAVWGATLAAMLPY